MPSCAFYNILVPESPGVKNIVCIKDAVFKLTDNVFKSINQKTHVEGILYGLAKAFYYINTKFC
jgi:hypothetical protein